MKKITVDNVIGGNIELGVVRYFMANNNKYLIYSLDEKEEQGLIKLYVGKVSTIIENISNDSEWEQVRDLIKQIIKEVNENNLKCIVDLPENELVELDLISSKAFRLPAFMGQLLETKKKEAVIVTETFTDATTDAATDAVAGANNETSNEKVKNSIFQYPEIERFDENLNHVQNNDRIKSSIPGGELERHFQSEASHEIDSNGELESQTISTNYQELYLKERESNRLLNEKINEYRQRMDSIKRMIDSIE